MQHRFKVGDRVIYTGIFYDKLINCSGVIVEEINPNQYYIDFDGVFEYIFPDFLKIDSQYLRDEKLNELGI